MSGTPLAIVFVEDLSEQVQAQQAVRLTTERLAAIVENAPLPIVSFGRDGTVETWNGAAERVLGWESAALIGRSFPCGAGLVSGEAIAEMVADGVRLEGVEMLGESADGTLRDFSVWAAPLRDGTDEVVGAVALLDDVTERNRLELDLRTALGQKQVLETRLTFQAMHDPLTGLANRRLFLERVGASIGDRQTAVLLLDLDDFKAVNDTHGHQTGDALLIAVANRLKSCLRDADLAARLGGDEFGILLVGCPSETVAREVATRVLRSLEEPFELDGRLLFAHASIGIAEATPTDDQVADLLSKADVAMYLAKGQGKGRLEVYQETMHADVLQRIALRTDLEEAINAHQFKMHYQPVYAIEDGRLQGVEALVRWDHPERGVLSPAEFIDLANETGLMVPLGQWILTETCRQMAAWQARWPHLATLELSVNLSAVQIRHPSFADDLRAALAASGLAPRLLVLELNQSVLTNSAAVIRTLEELKEIGVRIAIDDFGAGYAPLSYVGRFPVDILKIDRSFISALGTSAPEATLAATIVELAGSLNLKTVAEGIEQPEQLALLRTMGCQMGQGYYLARPLTVANMETLIVDRLASAPTA
jgi:diguanylate cyclase (GGDEF)-like protein/PAS domain S-box-containing protein